MKTLSNPLGTQSYRQGFGHGQRYPNTPAFGSLRGQRHLGTDWLLPTGGTLYAPEDGVISRLYTGQGGNTIVLEGRRYIHRFMHLSEYRVEVNQKVKKGQVIGITGNTGLSTAPHLHWDVWDKYNGAFNHLEFAGFVDPLSFPMIKELVPNNEENMNTSLYLNDAEWAGGIFEGREFTIRLHENRSLLDKLPRSQEFLNSGFKNTWHVHKRQATMEKTIEWWARHRTSEETRQAFQADYRDWDRRNPRKNNVDRRVVEARDLLNQVIK